MIENIKNKGSLHPITISINKISEIFTNMGFDLASGPEIETEFYNFDALNVPSHHPSRDMQDTFWIDSKKGILPRTHTSSVQIRFMEENSPPIRVASVGRVFRNEATDATHDFQFYQVEGLMVDEKTSLANLRFVLSSFFSQFFENEVSVRMRPSYFPFVEPGVEIDMSCFKCGGDGCGTCKNTGWIEIMGAGMVHPNVLKNAGLKDSEKYQGFAFGGGLDRFIMLKYGVDDIRLLYSGDLRFINQF